MFSLGTGWGGRALVLPQRDDETDLIDFSEEALTSLSSSVEGRRKAGGEERGGTAIGM